MSIIDPNSPGLFSFFAPKAGGPVSYPAMEMRRKIALQLLGNSRKGYPKNIGEGLTAIGDALGDRAVLNQLMGQESEFQKGIDTDYQRATGAPTATTPPTPGPQSALSPAIAPLPLATSELTPDERAAGVVGSEANALDAAAPTAAAPTAAVRGVTPNAQSWYNFAVKPLDQGGLGFSPAQAAAKVANLQAESSAKILPSGLTGDAGTAHGAAQWRNDRYYGSGNRQGLLSFAQANGLDPNSTETQQKFMRYEYMGPEKAAYSRITAAQTPQDAATAINRYYERSADRSGNREAIAARLAGLFGGAGAAPPMQTAPVAPMTPPVQPLTTADAAGIDRLGEVTGMGAGDRGYSYPPTASLGRQGDVQSDAPPLAGISPNVGAGVADTVQQNRDAVARARLPGLVPPAPRPTGPAGPTANVMSDITPAPPGAGAQLAQAVPPGAPRTAPFDPTVTPPPNAQLPEQIYPQIAPKSPLRLQNEAMAVRAAAMGDPQRAAMYKTAIENDETQRQELFQNQVKRWEQQRALPQRQQELIKSRSEADIAARFGDPTTHAKLIEDTAKSRGVADASANALTNIYQAHKALQSAVVGSGANAKISFIKALDALGYHGATSEAAASEIFKSLMAGNVAATIKETVGSQGISNADRQFGERAAGGDITMTREALEKLLDISRRHHVNNIGQHTDRLERTFNDPVRDSAVRRAYGVDVPYLPGAVERLRANPNEADQFDAVYGRGQAKRLLERSP